MTEYFSADNTTTSDSVLIIEDQNAQDNITKSGFNYSCCGISHTYNENVVRKIYYAAIGN